MVSSTSDAPCGGLFAGQFAKNYRGVPQMVNPNGWMVAKWKILFKWMMTGGRNGFSGNLHILSKEASSANFCVTDDGHCWASHQHVNHIIMPTPSPREEKNWVTEAAEEVAQ